MEKAFYILLFSISLTVQLRAQTGVSAPDALAIKIPVANTYATDQIAGYIKNNFATETERIRAIYAWITNHITYDVAKLHNRNANTTPTKQPVEDVLKTRTAVCQGYADLFLALCEEVGIKATFVGGYTKKDGVVSQLPHAWVAAEIAGNWHLYDPTWGSGYVKDNQFVRSPNNRYYQLAPAEMIKDHMPFDPMYQYLNQIISNREFIEGAPVVTATKTYFNYIDTLKRFTIISPTEKINSEIRRLEANGIRNELLAERVLYLKKEIERQSFNEANDAMKRSTALFNQYIDHKNKQFSTVTDTELQQLIDSVSSYTQQARSHLTKVNANTEASKQMVAGMYQHMEKFGQRLLKEKDFISRYLTADKAARRQLFGLR